jgi:hypothetical protein
MGSLVVKLALAAVLAGAIGLTLWGAIKVGAAGCVLLCVGKCAHGVGVRGRREDVVQGAHGMQSEGGWGLQAHRREPLPVMEVLVAMARCWRFESQHH